MLLKLKFNYAGDSPSATAGVPAFSPFSNSSARVTISCPESQIPSKLILLPMSFQELLDIGAQRFGLSPTRVMTEGGAEIDDVEIIRDGDHLILVSAGYEIQKVES
ncbi:hypothetical protein REPUB_Repub03eG0117200 [Reevesia pubescens]